MDPRLRGDDFCVLCTQKSLRQRVDLLVPLVEQTLALRGAAVLGEVVIDELDLAHLRCCWGNRRCAVRWRLEVLGVRSDLLRGGREGPVVELLGILEISGTFDDAHRADFEPGAFAGDNDFHRKSIGDLRDAIVQERDGDRGFTARRGPIATRSDRTLRIVVRLRLQSARNSARIWPRRSHALGLRHTSSSRRATAANVFLARGNRRERWLCRLTCRRDGKTMMRNATRFATHRALDVICLGRFAVDFYAQQIGARLEDVTSFAKYLGGSSANTALGCAG